MTDNQPLTVAEVMRSADAQAQEYQARLVRQREIIDRYDRFRQWVLEEVVEDMRTCAEELRAVGARLLGNRIDDLIQEIINRGEQPQ